MVVSTFIELRQINESMRQNLVEGEHSNTQLIKDLLKELSKIKEKLGRMKEFCQCITENANRLKSVTEIASKVPFQESKKPLDSITWEINNINDQMEQGQDGKYKVLKSVPFYFIPFEYKYRMWVYINGNGIDLDRHISIFFVVMESEYDHLLEWPMKKKISFELIDQENVTVNVSGTFTCHLNDRNRSVGVARFIFAGDFIENNCVYIKTTVENTY